jgi:uncharacterized membrane protein
MSDPLFALTLVTALGCALSAGALFAFSSFAMAGLRRLPAPQGIAAMQSINRTALTPVFMTALLGTALACAGLGVYALSTLDERPAGYLLAAAALYIVGTIALTRGYHVPRNDALDRLDPSAPEAESHWRRYVSEWTRWNHVRGAAALAAAALFTVALAS